MLVAFSSQPEEEEEKKGKKHLSRAITHEADRWQILILIVIYNASLSN